MRTVTLIVDYQNDFTCGSLGFERGRSIDDNIVVSLEEAIERGDDIVETKDTHYSDYLNTFEGEHLPIEHTIIGTSGHDTYGKVGQLLEKINHIVINKTAFGSLELGALLKKLDSDVDKGPIKCVRVHGLLSNLCVLSAIVIGKAALPEAEFIVDNLTCASNDESLHEKTLDILESMMVTVINRNK